MTSIIPMTPMTPMTGDSGYRHTPASGPRLRTDIIDAYIFRRTGEDVEFLQLLRAGPPLADTWHPVMAHIEAGETAVQCLHRELTEEVGLHRAHADLVGLWALEQVHPFFIAELDAIVLSPRFAAEVSPRWTPILNSEHRAHRWVAARGVAEMFMWPGQLAAIREIIGHLLPVGSLARERLRLP